MSSTENFGPRRDRNRFRVSSPFASPPPFNVSFSAQCFSHEESRKFDLVQMGGITEYFCRNEKSVLTREAFHTTQKLSQSFISDSKKIGVHNIISIEKIDNNRQKRNPNGPRDGKMLFDTSNYCREKFRISADEISNELYVNSKADSQKPLPKPLFPLPLKESSFIHAIRYAKVHRQIRSVMLRVWIEKIAACCCGGRKAVLSKFIDAITCTLFYQFRQTVLGIFFDGKSSRKSTKVESASSLFDLCKGIHGFRVCGSKGTGAASLCKSIARHAPWIEEELKDSYSAFHEADLNSYLEETLPLRSENISISSSYLSSLALILQSNDDSILGLQLESIINSQFSALQDTSLEGVLWNLTVEGISRRLSFKKKVKDLLRDKKALKHPESSATYQRNDPSFSAFVSGGGASFLLLRKYHLLESFEKKQRTKGMWNAHTLKPVQWEGKDRRSSSDDSNERLPVFRLMKTLQRDTAREKDRNSVLYLDIYVACSETISKFIKFWKDNSLPIFTFFLLDNTEDADSMGKRAIWGRGIPSFSGPIDDNKKDMDDSLSFHADAFSYYHHHPVPAEIPPPTASESCKDAEESKKEEGNSGNSSAEISQEGRFVEGNSSSSPETQDFRLLSDELWIDTSVLLPQRLTKAQRLEIISLHLDAFFRKTLVPNHLVHRWKSEGCLPPFAAVEPHVEAIKRILSDCTQNFGAVDLEALISRSLSNVFIRQVMASRGESPGVRIIDMIIPHGADHVLETVSQLFRSREDKKRRECASGNKRDVQTSSDLLVYEDFSKVLIGMQSIASTQFQQIAVVPYKHFTKEDSCPKDGSNIGANVEDLKAECRKPSSAMFPFVVGEEALLDQLIDDIVIPYHEPKAMKTLPLGIIVEGDSKSGKSLICHWISNALQAHQIIVDFSSFRQRVVGESEKMVRKVISSLPRFAPAVIIIKNGDLLLPTKTSDALTSYDSDSELDVKYSDRLWYTFCKEIDAIQWRKKLSSDQEERSTSSNLLFVLLSSKSLEENSTIYNVRKDLLVYSEEKMPPMSESSCVPLPCASCAFFQKNRFWMVYKTRKNQSWCQDLENHVKIFGFVLEVHTDSTVRKCIRECVEAVNVPEKLDAVLRERNLFARPRDDAQARENSKGRASVTYQSKPRKFGLGLPTPAFWISFAKEVSVKGANRILTMASQSGLDEKEDIDRFSLLPDDFFEALEEVYQRGTGAKN